MPGAPLPRAGPKGPSGHPLASGRSVIALDPAPAPTLWIRCHARRPILAAHLRGAAGRFREDGWRIVRGEEPPTAAGVLAVLDDPWAEPLPESARALAAADAPRPGMWRVPRVNGVDPPQGWSPSPAPYTLRDYRRAAVAGFPRAEPSPRPLWCGLAVAAAGDAAGLSGGWPPAAGTIALVPQVHLYRYDDPADHERRELDPYLPTGIRTLVDVGCGAGRFGGRHRAAGRRVIGIEPDPELARAAAARLDLVLPLPAAEALAALAPPIDCFVFADVLEHLAEPEAALAAAAALLAPGGLLLVSYPNAAWAPVLRALAAGRWDPTLAGVQARDHLRPLTPAALEQMAAEAGLGVVRHEPLAPAPLTPALRLWAWLAARTAGGSGRALAGPQWVAVLAAVRPGR